MAGEGDIPMLDGGKSRVGVGDCGDEGSPRWFLNQEDVSGGELENTLHRGSLFVDICRENGEDEVFRHWAMDLRRGHEPLLR
jgi:hypothetical protein